MDPISIIAGIGLLLSIAANSSAAKGGLKRAVTKSERKPNTYLQKTPLNISALILILQILGVFQIGAIKYESEYQIFRIIGLILFAIFAWLQVKSFKNLGDFYSQEISLQKNHQLVSTGIHKTIRHPQYISQILSDLFLGIALGSYIIIPLVLLVELPLFILRAKKEEAMMLSFFGDKYSEYKKKSSFIIPVIW
ncbi:MAG: isoprenylcysteine carboxylmethyltransferase family protein [Melioribacteraceae bacterium]|nr:isoprenylcysteine carboxylmethyltransferase family protein [Melioribacteraceae bacterium]